MSDVLAAANIVGLPKGRAPIYADYYAYAVRVTSLASSASSSANIQIEADSHFIVSKISYFADIAGAAQTNDSRVIPLVRVVIKDSASGRELSNIPLDLANVGGADGMPFLLPTRRAFQPNSTLTFTFTNYSASTTYANVSFVLHGTKVWY